MTTKELKEYISVLPDDVELLIEMDESNEPLYLIKHNEGNLILVPGKLNMSAKDLAIKNICQIGRLINYLKNNNYGKQDISKYYK